MYENITKGSGRIKDGLKWLQQKRFQLETARLMLQ